nr:guanine deaminase [Pantoea sp. BAV 3049]
MKKFVCSIAVMLISLAAHAEKVGYRGDVLYFTADPASHPEAVHNYQDGLLIIDMGKVVAAGDYETLKTKYDVKEIVDYRGRIITPGFIDTHVHYPQISMTGSYGEQLIGCLNDYTFPTEEKFSDKQYDSHVSDTFLKQLIDNGTTTALVFATSNPVSVDALFQSALQKNMRVISGKVLMDRNAPAPLLDTPETAYSQSKALILKWQHKGRLDYAVTPRFAPTSTDAELAIAGKLLKEFPDVYLHTHLAENNQEVAWVKKLFPWSRSYLDVYDHYGLVTAKSIFAHAIHLDDQDYAVAEAKQANFSFCPTSNLFLGSGLFNLDKARKYHINVGLGTDIGAGTTFSLLQVMDEAYKVTQLRKAYSENPQEVTPLSPMENLYLATLGGAKALSLDKYIGSFENGKEADFVVLNPASTELLKMRTANSKNTADVIFPIEIMGDDRTVEHTYIMGNKAK